MGSQQDWPPHEMNTEPRRPDPELLLRQVESEEARQKRGSLKVFLGYASGVGKSFRMLDEARRRKERGEDLVVVGTQADRSTEVDGLLGGCEVIPLKQVNGVPVLDMEKILQRKPGVAVIDGLAFENPPGWPTHSRWQDVERLLDEGISVITSLNIQYIAERADQIAKIRGRRAPVTVPESFLHRADEIVVVDAPPEYCIDRANQLGASAEDLQAMEKQLSELREIALLLAADVVEHQLEKYLTDRGLEQSYGTQERILVCITPRGDASTMIRRGRRQADRFHGELYVAYVDQPDLAGPDRKALDENLALANSLGAKVEVLDGENTVQVILRFARSHGITQIFVGHSGRTGWWDRLRGNPVERLIQESEGIDVRIFPN
jgi:two-component system sensor histidine kinase KdpD